MIYFGVFIFGTITGFVLTGMFNEVRDYESQEEIREQYHKGYADGYNDACTDHNIDNSWDD